MIVSGKKERQLRGKFTQKNPDMEYAFIHSLDELFDYHPDCVLSKISNTVDPVLVNHLVSNTHRHIVHPALQEIFTDRIALVDRIKGTCSVPAYLAFNNSTDPDVVAAFVKTHGKVILKPALACGDDSAHVMRVCDSLKDVESFSANGTRVLMQEFVPHEGFFLKIFVIGNHVSVYARESLDNPPLIGENFNSQGLFSSPSPASVSLEIQAEAIEISKGISGCLQVPLLGVDIVLRTPSSSSKAGNLLVVDVNFFPSYSEVGDRFISLLDQLIVSLDP